MSNARSGNFIKNAGYFLSMLALGSTLVATMPDYAAADEAKTLSRPRIRQKRDPSGNGIIELKVYQNPDYGDDARLTFYMDGVQLYDVGYTGPMPSAGEEDLYKGCKAWHATVFVNDCNSHKIQARITDNNGNESLPSYSINATP
ncbi:MAG: hypothetical protein V1870_03050 [Candidatus Aenigmatarchaeota archaeon]